MSDRSFLRRFRAATGLTPTAYLRRLRVARARALLETTRDASIRISSAIAAGSIAMSRAPLPVGTASRLPAITMRRAAGSARTAGATGRGANGFFRIGYGQCQIDTWYGLCGASAVTLKSWTNNLKVNGLWSNDARRNAYAHFSGLDRRKLPNSNDSAHLTLTMLAATAE